MTTSTDNSTRGARQMKIALSAIIPNPNQPRKHFDQHSLKELADSIKQNGLLQPIKVRPNGNGTYMIICGERRYRAHQLLGLEKIVCNVSKVDDDEMALQAIVENLQRSDIKPVEQALAYQQMLDRGFSIEELAKRLGLKQSWRINERLSLLNLRPQYRALVNNNGTGLTPSQAFEMSRLNYEKQDKIFELLKKGKLNSYNLLRQAVNSLLDTSPNEQSGFGWAEPSAEEVAQISEFEKKLNSVISLVAEGFNNENEVDVLAKVNPNKAAAVLEQINLIQKHLEMLKKPLEQVGVKGLLAS